MTVIIEILKHTLRVKVVNSVGLHLKERRDVTKQALRFLSEVTLGRKRVESGGE